MGSPTGLLDALSNSPQAGLCGRDCPIPVSIGGNQVQGGPVIRSRAHGWFGQRSEWRPGLSVPKARAASPFASFLGSWWEPRAGLRCGASLWPRRRLTSPAVGPAQGLRRIRTEAETAVPALDLGDRTLTHEPRGKGEEGVGQDACRLGPRAAQGSPLCDSGAEGTSRPRLNILCSAHPQLLARDKCPHAAESTILELAAEDEPP